MKLNVEHTARVEPMPLFSFEGKRPTVHPSAFIAPTAVLIGDVTVEERASVWYNAVLRGDFDLLAFNLSAELVFTKTLWPDFGARELYLAVADFQRRDRRFGRV